MSDDVSKSPTCLLVCVTFPSSLLSIALVNATASFCHISVTDLQTNEVCSLPYRKHTAQDFLNVFLPPLSML